MWIYVPNPSTASQSAPGAEASILPSNSQLARLEASFWWRGKPTPAKSWLRLWKRAPWLRRLYGRMPEPSTADHGAASWIASLAAYRASLIARPDYNSAPTMSETSGPTPNGSSRKPSPGWSSSRTSAECSTPAAPSKSSETFGAMATRLRSDYSRRQSVAQRRSGSGYLSSLWPIPQASEAGPDFAKMDRSATGLALPARAVMWSSIRASDGEKGGPAQSFGGGGTPLPAQAVAFSAMWNAPTVASATGGQVSRGGDRKGEPLLGGQAIAVSSRLAPKTSTVGMPTSKTGLSLNPLFVEALMAWPTGLSVCASSEMELFRWREDMRFVISQLPLPSRAPEVQRDLFG